MSNDSKASLQNQTDKFDGDNLFDFAKMFYNECKQSQQECLLFSLKKSLKETLNEINDSKQINSMHLKMNSIIDIFPFVINQYISSFLNIGSKEFTSIAKTCQDFCKIYTFLTKQQYFDTIPITVKLNYHETWINFYRQNKMMDYVSAQRYLKYNPCLNLSMDFYPGSFSVTCDQFFNECKPLLSQIRKIDCANGGLFLKFLTHGIEFPKLQYLKIDEFDREVNFNDTVNFNCPNLR